ncbi:hypothetical protein KUTeg_021537 [Tegillarca granosa]|uniref:Ig-like domain-containing protein n=1 Tax=Tegillarca granosa TaxID=220873 RepID=A0ABQ9E3K8_TEGGR|nr:hypothetical protein KUTeg_021537 [Tegillarca granosa]
MEGPRLLTNRVGETGEIPCQAVGNPKPNIVWRKDGRIIASNGKYRIENNGTLNDTGSYYCTATNVIGRKTVERTLRIQGLMLNYHTVPPRITFSQSTSCDCKLKNKMSCAAEGIPTPLITWTRNQIHVPVSSVDGHSSLIIRNALLEDAGLYTCTATNPAGIAEASATVLMKEFLLQTGMKKAKNLFSTKSYSPDGDTVVSIAEKVILTCSVGGDPLPEITWTKNGRTVEYNERIQLLSNGSLVIYHSTSADAGLYKCLASNDAGTDIGVAMLTVHEGEPQPDITWMRGWTEIIPEGRVSVLSNHSLRILAAQLTDSGLYKCKASNRLGITIVEANITVVVDGRYSQWSEWDICSSTCGIGVQFRTRSCTDPEPANVYNVQFLLSVDGEWGNWLPWEHCSVSCGRGEMIRHRLCDNPMPRFDGRYCDGVDTETQECESVPCPINGNWGDWSSWGLCSVTCGDGLQERYRDCDNPPASYGGQDCIGSETETKPCTAQICAVNSVIS